jgi:hypothetical protein
MKKDDEGPMTKDESAAILRPRSQGERPMTKDEAAILVIRLSSFVFGQKADS